MRFAFAALVLPVALSVSVVWGQTPIPIGEEFQVNSYTTHRQVGPWVAIGPEGGFLVVWNSNHTASQPNNLSYDVQGRRYDPTGTPLGAEFTINTYTTGSQERSEVSVDANGNVVVAWTSFGSGGTDTSEWSVQARRYDGAGSPLGTEFQVNEYTSGRQWNPSVAMHSDGSFVVAWESYGSSGTDSSGPSIQARLYDAAGDPVGGEFQVNAYTSNFQNHPSVAMSSGGDFVVVWHSYGSAETDTSNFSVQGQRFDVSGVPIGGQFQVNTYTNHYQYFAQVAVTKDDGFVVVWSGANSSDPDGVTGQRFDAMGTAVGGEFQVNAYTTSYQAFMGTESVAAIADGGFVVVWSSDGSYGTDNSSYSVLAQRYSASNMPLGSQFQVNSYTTASQGYLGVAVGSGSDGDFVVVWDSVGSYGTDTDSWSVQAQRYVIPMIFTDGFESGDTSAWTRTVP